MFTTTDGEITCESKIFGKYIGCGWTGKISECIKTYYKLPPESWMSLAGREGYVYKCPNCGRTLHENWIKMS